MCLFCPFVMAFMAYEELWIMKFCMAYRFSYRSNDNKWNIFCGTSAFLRICDFFSIQITAAFCIWLQVCSLIWYIVTFLQHYLQGNLENFNKWLAALRVGLLSWCGIVFLRYVVIHKFSFKKLSPYCMEISFWICLANLVLVPVSN